MKKIYTISELTGTDKHIKNKSKLNLFDVISRFLGLSIYGWMLKNLPQKLMFKNVYIDEFSTMPKPRFGWSKWQILKAQKDAKKLKEELGW